MAKQPPCLDRKSTRLNSSHGSISYAVFCLKKKNLRSEEHTSEIQSREQIAHPRLIRVRAQGVCLYRPRVCRLCAASCSAAPRGAAPPCSRPGGPPAVPFACHPCAL